MDYELGELNEYDYVWSLIFFMTILNEYMFKIDFIDSIQKDIFGFITLIAALFIWYFDYRRKKQKEEKIKKSLIIYELDCNIDYIYKNIYLINKKKFKIYFALLDNLFLESALKSFIIVDLFEQSIIQDLDLFNNKVKTINGLIESKDPALLDTLEYTYKKLEEIYKKMGLTSQWQILDEEAKRKYPLESKTS